MYDNKSVLDYSIACIYVYVNIYVYVISIYDINIVPYILLMLSILKI